MLLIQNGYMIDAESGREGYFDILTDGEKIVQIGEKLPVPAADCTVIDAKGLVAAPGLVDVHVHFREPGFTQKEDILTERRLLPGAALLRLCLWQIPTPRWTMRKRFNLFWKKGKQQGFMWKPAAMSPWACRAKN